MTVDTEPHRSRNILVILDEFTRYPEVITLRDMTAHTVARVFFDQWILRYGLPQEIITDRGSNFVSDLFTSLCKLLRIKKLTTAAYRPQANGSNERLHRTLYTILRGLREVGYISWERQLDLALFVYRTSYHRSIDMTPHQALFGYMPRQTTLAEDYFSDDTILAPALSSETWLAKRLQSLQHMREQMYQTMKIAQDKSLQYANRKRSLPDYNIGDRVFIREHVRSKLDPFWNHTGTIVERINDVDYVIAFDDPECRRHPVIHAQHLRLAAA
jgi:hypothetical protein